MVKRFEDQWNHRSGGGRASGTTPLKNYGGVFVRHYSKKTFHKGTYFIHLWREIWIPTSNIGRDFEISANF